jgi:Histidine kinase-, DNA gyrase B-, and HSP90-like ATPase
MSKVNIKRTVENIRANTTVYSPIVEVVVNALQAIEGAGRQDGQITIRIQRDGQTEMDGGLPEIRSFEVEDNGVGFTDANRESFDTLYSDLKIAEGGKGFGRFICLKYFANVHIDSVFSDGKKLKWRTFSMGRDSDIIINEKVADAPKAAIKTVVHLKDVKDKKFTDKKLQTIARNLVEKLLPNFITKGYLCPRIVLAEAESGESICLNDWFNNELAGVIKEMDLPNSEFSLKAFEVDEPFTVRVFKFYFPKNQKSKISLVAHKREVAGSPLHDYIPEFIEEFYDKDVSGNSVYEKNYIIKAYVFGPYLDRHVSLDLDYAQRLTRHCPSEA